MIPADVVSRLRLANELATQPPAPTQKLTDALSDFVPGQRLMATIQALLPNGTYRAMIAQRDITLALPFAAKAGDALELEVVESHGKMSLAVVAGGTAKQAAGDSADDASVATRLTTTGRLIADLLTGLDKEAGKRPQPAPLNNAQPVVNRFPDNPADLAPALKAALSKSGMFYESHQAQWVRGQLPTAVLLQEPQGRQSPALHALLQGTSAAASGTQGNPANQGASAPLMPAPSASTLANPPSIDTTDALADSAAPVPGRDAGAGAKPGLPGAAAAVLENSGRSASATEAATRLSEAHNPASSNALRVGMGQVIAPDLTPLVQQQLESLATQAYVWQGQVWPGQNMEWEIVEENGQQSRGENTSANWTTHLRLDLPNLGGLHATLRLVGGKEVEVTVRTEHDATRQRLNAANAPLQQQFATAGLKLKSLAIARHAPEPQE